MSKGSEKPGSRPSHFWWVASLVVLALGGAVFAYVILRSLKAFGCVLLFGLADEC